VVTESKVNIIFAVPEDSIDVYKQLSEHIPGSSIGVLKHDSSNIVDIIRENFEKITSKVELRDNSSNAVEIRYISSCLGSSKSETKICHNIGNGKTIEFDVELKVTKCPPNGNETFVITPIGVDEYTVVELHVMCECECELEPTAKVNSSKCSHFGTSACGVCECDPNRFGKRCECSGGDAIRQDMINQCKRYS
jgi:protocadherin alpha